jgi:hypothetical protein
MKTLVYDETGGANKLTFIATFEIFDGFFYKNLMIYAVVKCCSFMRLMF